MATFTRMGESVVAVSLYRDPDERPEAIAELLPAIAAEFERPGQGDGRDEPRAFCGEGATCADAPGIRGFGPSPSLDEWRAAFIDRHGAPSLPPLPPVARRARERAGNQTATRRMYQVSLPGSCFVRRSSTSPELVTAKGVASHES
jgi:hypothetical protein